MVQETYLVWENIGVKSGEFDYIYQIIEVDTKSLVMFHTLDIRF